jgi:heme/copper-type cytochrome/quinol oxidase subunit 1
VIALSILLFFINIFVTLRKPRTATNDPWEANTLEWATTSPPPAHNFDSLPQVHSDRPVYDARIAAGGTT